MVGMRIVGKGVFPDVVGIPADGLAHDGAQVGVGLGEFRDEAGREPDQVMQDQDLAVTAGPGADADGRDA